MKPTPIAVCLSGGPFCGAGGVVALQPVEMPVYLIQDMGTRQVHAYRWANRMEEEAGVPIGWVLTYVCAVGAPAAVTPGIPGLGTLAEFRDHEFGLISQPERKDPNP